jgi:hypothetical protein
MFTIEQNISQNLKNKAKNALFQPGTTLAKPMRVRPNFTYKEFTLVLGIVVAIMVAITLWTRQPTEGSASEVTVVPAISLPKSGQRIVTKTGENIIQAALRTLR